MTDSAESVIQSLKNLLSRYPQLELAAVFGSVAVGKADFDSDIDIAVQARQPLSVAEKIELIEAISLLFNRPVDLVDFRTAGQPLLHQIVSTGIQILGSRQQWGDLMFRNIMENEDFVPYQQRILEGRRKAWINS